MNSKMTMQRIFWVLSAGAALFGIAAVGLVSGTKLGVVSLEPVQTQDDSREGVRLAFFHETGKHLNDVVVFNAVDGDPAKNASKATGKTSNQVRIPTSWTTVRFQAPGDLGKREPHELSSLISVDGVLHVTMKANGIAVEAKK